MKNEVIQSPSLKVQMTRNFFILFTAGPVCVTTGGWRPDNFSKKFKGLLTSNYTTFSLKWATVDENARILNKKKTVKDCQRFLILILFITRM